MLFINVPPQIDGIQRGKSAAITNRSTEDGIQLAVRPSDVVFEAGNVGRFIVAELASGLMDSLKVSLQNRAVVGGKRARAARNRGFPVVSHVLLDGLDGLRLELALLAGQANVQVLYVVLLVPVIPQLCFAFLAHKCAQVARYRLRCLFLPFFHGTRRFVAVEVTTGNVILSAVLAHILVRNSVSFLLVLDDVRLRRGLEVTLVALDYHSLLVALLVDPQCEDSDCGEIAEVAFVGANLSMLFKYVVDDVLPHQCLKSTEVAFPGASAGNSTVSLLIVGVQRSSRLNLKIDF